MREGDWVPGGGERRVRSSVIGCNEKYWPLIGSGASQNDPLPIDFKTFAHLSPRGKNPNFISVIEEF